MRKGDTIQGRTRVVQRFDEFGLKKKTPLNRKLHIKLHYINICLASIGHLFYIQRRVLSLGWSQGGPWFKTTRA